MNKSRLEAFSDGVLAIIITILVLEMKAPDETSVWSLLPLAPIFLSYVLSFIYVAIFWINHHHILQATKYVSTSVLWANINILFWLSLIPFSTSWINENQIEPVPVAFYGFILCMCAIAFRVLEIQLLNMQDNQSPLLKYFCSGYKERLTIAIYVISIPLAFVHSYISIFLYVIAAGMWIIPNRDLEKSFFNEKQETKSET